MGRNVLILKFVIFLTMQISLEKEADLIFLRGPLRLMTTTGCVLYGDSLTVSWSIYLQTYQSSNYLIASNTDSLCSGAPASIQYNLFLLCLD